MTPFATTNGRPRCTRGVDKEVVRGAIGSRAVEFLVSIGIPAEVLDGRHHPCPKCGGKDRFRLIDAAAGAIFCSQCFSQKNGDLFAATSWWSSCNFRDALVIAAKFAGLYTHDTTEAGDENNSPNTNRGTTITFESACKSKGMPVESAKAYGASATKWGGKRVIQFPMYGPDGKQCTCFGIPAEGGKGKYAKGLPAGLFLPHREGHPVLPSRGDEWLVVEGVKDAAALHALGFNAVGLPTSSMNSKFAQLFVGASYYRSRS